MCDSDDGGDVYSNRNISLSDKPIKQSRVMKTKKINVEFEQAKVVNMDVDLQNLENYMSKFLALKNHQRHTDEILDVSGFDGSNKVRVVILIDDEEDETISANLETLSVSGVKMIKDIIIVPIGNTLLYVEPIYQVRANELETQVLKKIIVASGDKVAIGDDLEAAIENLLSEKNSIKLEYIDMDDIEQVIDSIIEANGNLKDSINSGDLEMIGKDLSALETLLEQLEILREQELEDGGKVNESTK
mgnify:CR=1 FL=1